MNGRFVFLPKKLNHKNYISWQQGMVSRLLGLLISCVSSAIHLLGLSLELVRTLTVQMVIDQCGFVNPPSKEEIIQCIHKLLGIDVNSIDNPTEIVFHEPVLSCGPIAPMEKEIFPDSGSYYFAGRSGVRSEGTSGTNNPQPRFAELPFEDLCSVFSSQELTTYKVAARAGQTSSLMELNEKAKKLLISSGRMADPAQKSTQPFSAESTELAAEQPQAPIQLSQPSPSVPALPVIQSTARGRRASHVKPPKGTTFPGSQSDLAGPDTQNLGIMSFLDTSSPKIGEKKSSIFSPRGSPYFLGNKF